MTPASVSSALDENLKQARQNYLELHELYRPLDEQIAAARPDWDSADRFRAHLVALCEDTVLTMLGADHRFTSEELAAFNILFALDEPESDIKAMSSWLNQRHIVEAELFSRLDRFVLASMLVDTHLGSQRTEQALSFFQTLGQVIALIDDHYHPTEDAFFRALSERIISNWRQADAFSQESTPALMLTLSDGRQTLYSLS